MIGNFSLEADRPHLTPQEKNFIETVIQQTALALENIRLVEETQRTAQQERVISAISEELSRAMDVENVIKTAVRELGRLPNIREVSIHIEPDSQIN
jgi:GAF domain-containing protein